MSVIADSRERSELLKAGCDGVRLLEYGVSSYSYDYLITRANEPKTLRCERKSFWDLVSSFHKIDRQLSICDVLIVEMPRGRDDYDRKPELVERTFKRLARLSLNVAVIWSLDEQMTLDILRYLERRPSLDLKPRKTLKGDVDEDFFDGLFRLLGISPTRITPEGSLSSLLRGQIDTQALAEALGIARWDDIPGIGPKTLSGVRERLSEK